MNVLWVFGDQMRAQAQGHMGDPNVATPNIDRLAAEGVVFTQAVSGCPLCCPYRGSLLTGRYPHQAVPGHEDPIPEDMPTVAHAFRDAGYRTAWFGKWHLGGWKERDGRAGLHVVPRARRGGFNTWIGYENNNSQWDCHVHGHDEDGAEVAPYRLPGFETDALTDLLIDYLRRGAKEQQGRPFFAALSVQPPHDPYTAPAEYMARYRPASLTLRPNVPEEVGWVNERARRELAGYYALIENLDHNLGRVRDALAELGLTDDTLIVFFSDHGDMHGSHGQFRKTSPWEEAVRVPFIIGGGVPFYGAKRGRIPVPINHVDVAPTTLGLCGVPVPAGMAGFDYSARYLKGRPVAAADEPDSAYLQLVRPTRHGDSVDRAWRGVATRDGWKYAVLPGQEWLMFDLNTDPYERVNLAHNSAFAAQRERLRQRLARWIAETGDDFTLPE